MRTPIKHKPIICRAQQSFFFRFWGSCWEAKSDQKVTQKPSEKQLVFSIALRSNVPGFWTPQNIQKPMFYFRKTCVFKGPGLSFLVEKSIKNDVGTRCGIGTDLFMCFCRCWHPFWQLLASFFYTFSASFF